MLDHYLQSIVAAWGYLMPSRTPPLVALPLPGVAPAVFHSVAEAQAWLQAELHVLLPIMQQASDGEFGPHAWQIPCAISPFLHGEVSWRAMTDALDHALVVARKSGDIDGQVMARQQLGWLWSRLGSIREVDQHLAELNTLAPQFENVCSATLARLRARGGSNSCPALDDAERTLRTYRDTDDLEDRLHILWTVRRRITQHLNQAESMESAGALKKRGRHLNANRRHADGIGKRRSHSSFRE